MNLGRGILGELDGMATLTFCGGDPVNCVDPTGLEPRIDSEGFIVTGKGHHPFPVELWETFKFPDEAKRIFDAKTLKMSEGTLHGGKYHGWLTGYTGHVSELANTEIAAYMTEKGIKDNKPTIKQSEELARRILEKIEKTDNLFIQGFNKSVTKTDDFLKWGTKFASNLDKPTESVVREIHKLKGIARIPAPKGYTYIKRVPLGKPFMFFLIAGLSTIEYNNARADGLDTVDATLSAGVEIANPYPVGLSDMRNAVKPYDKAFEGAKAMGEGRLKEKTGIPLIDGQNENNKKIMELKEFWGGEE